MPPELTEEARLRRNARARDYYHANRERILTRKSEKEKQLTKEQRNERYHRDREKNLQRSRAWKRVAIRVARRKWPWVGFFKCTDCDAQAQSYHHEDYSLWWSVEPLCHKCHGIRHRKAPD